MNNKFTTLAKLQSVHIVTRLFRGEILLLRTDTSVRKKLLRLVEMTATNVKYVRKPLLEKILFKSTYPKCTVGKGTVVTCVLPPLPKAIS